MNIQDQAAHLANLTFIMDFHEKLGTTKNPLIVQEFERGHAELVKALEEKHHETGNGADHKLRPEARTAIAGSESRSGSANRSNDIKRPSSADVHNQY